MVKMGLRSTSNEGQRIKEKLFFGFCLDFLSGDFSSLSSFVLVLILIIVLVAAVAVVADVAGVVGIGSSLLVLCSLLLLLSSLVLILILITSVVVAVVVGVTIVVSVTIVVVVVFIVNVVLCSLLLFVVLLLALLSSSQALSPGLRAYLLVRHKPDLGLFAMLRARFLGLTNYVESILTLHHTTNLKNSSSIAIQLDL